MPPSICVSGLVAAQLLKMPSLVGEIFAGILLGPTLVPFPISFLMLGKTGLILLVIEAGISLRKTSGEGMRGIVATCAV